MTKPLYILLLIVFCGCGPYNYIKIKGKAINIKEGAAIESTNLYVLDTFYTWNKKQINREYLVKGKLLEIDYRYDPDTMKIISQSCNCIRKIILEPKFRKTLRGFLHL